MPGPISAALSNLRNSLDSVTNIADEIDKDVGRALRDSTVLGRHLTMQRAATVILSGFLESFLREAAQEAISELCSMQIPFDQLHRKIRSTHYRGGIDYVKREVEEANGRYAFEDKRAAAAAARLASPGSSASYDLIWEAFAETHANPGPETIKTYLKRFGVQNPMEKLAEATGTPAPSLTTRLRSFISVRNECAHTGSSKIDLTTSDVRSYRELIELVANGVASVLRDVLPAHR